jgi:hypothetical protein
MTSCFSASIASNALPVAEAGAKPSDVLRSRSQDRKVILKLGAVVLTALASTTSWAIDVCHENAPQLRATFDQALVNEHANVRVTRIVNVEDRREFGCHLIFDMSDGSQTQGIFLASEGALKWTADDTSSSSYAPRLMSEPLPALMSLIQALQSNMPRPDSAGDRHADAAPEDPNEGDGGPQDSCHAPAFGTAGFWDWQRAHANDPKAPPGYFYPQGNCKYIAVDPCRRKQMFQAGTRQWLNSPGMKPRPFASPVATIIESLSVDRGELGAIGLQFTAAESSMVCHQILEFADGRRQGGIISIEDPGAYAALQLTWTSDADIAIQRAKVDRLSTRKDLLVKVDLKTIAIQDCVGRETALGASEQFAGQLWAACADPNYKRH